jgi:hypothetical protein
MNKRAVLEEGKSRKGKPDIFQYENTTKLHSSARPYASVYDQSREND